ncbi:hypothetical protein [Spongiimicrobium sp. 2-473A-2-J]|uniref:hypothetical protein n=1 Tax=Eudoraea algarum TaxID=3417568 RepID=UPI003D365999
MIKATISQVGLWFFFGVKDAVYLEYHHAKAWQQMGKLIAHFISFLIQQKNRRANEGQ